MPFLIRSATLNGFADVTRQLGLDPVVLLREAGLPPQSLTEPDLKVSTEAIIDLFERTAARAGTEDLGLRLAVARHFSTLGTVGLIMREQPDVRHATEALSEHIWTHVEGLTLDIQEEDGLAILTTAFAGIGNRPFRQASELIVAGMVQLLRRFLGSDWRPEMVMFSHDRPEALSRHISLFGRRPLFNQERSAIAVLSSDLDTQIADADPNTADQLVRYLEFVAGSRDASYTSRVREIIHLLLPRGQCQIANVARQFGVNRRTLHRKLAQEDISFTELMEQERCDLARAYLANGHRSLTEIADLLGFSCLSAFSRWKQKSMAEIHVNKL